MKKNKIINLFFHVLIINLVFSQVDDVGDDFFLLTQYDENISLPYFSNNDIYTANTNINTAIIVIHGINRNAGPYHNSILHLVSNNGLDSEALVIAPQFLITTDIDNWVLDNSTVFWTNNTQWMSGGQSHATNQHPRDYEISSFAIMDSLIGHLLSFFPSLENISIVGNSAGGQFVNRYAAGSNQMGEGKIKYIVSSPSSFLYFDENRFDDYSQPYEWVIPNNCNGYNDYKYGLNNLNPYLYEVGIDSIRSRYFRRNINYLIGENDFGGTDDCESMVQGDNRFDRSIIYFNYLQNYFGDQVLNNHKIALIADTDHSYFEVFNSFCGEYAILGTGNCDQIDQLQHPDVNFSFSPNSGDYPLDVTFINETVSGTHTLEPFIWTINGDQVTSNGNMDYTFTYPGFFEIGLTAIDQIGISDTFIHSQLIQVDTLYGDLDLNAIINAEDASLILKYLTGEVILDTLQQLVGDVNNDQILTSFDASLILQYIDGNLDSLSDNLNLENYDAEGELASFDIFSQQGQIVTIPIKLENVNNLFNFSISLNYDNLILQSGSIYSGEITDLGFQVESQINDDGSILLTGASSIPLNENAILFNLYFIPGDFPSEQTVISCDELILNNIVSTPNFEIIINQSLSIINDVLPKSFTLYDNYPNPFNSNTTLKYFLQKSSYVNIGIFDMSGGLVKSLLNKTESKGEKYVKWDGRNNSGMLVASGIYFFKIKTPTIEETKKMLLLY